MISITVTVKFCFIQQQGEAHESGDTILSLKERKKEQKALTFQKLNMHRRSQMQGQNHKVSLTWKRCSFHVTQETVPSCRVELKHKIREFFTPIQYHSPPLCGLFTVWIVDKTSS